VNTVETIVLLPISLGEPIGIAVDRDGVSNAARGDPR
jgi:hypothetical protein